MTVYRRRHIRILTHRGDTNKVAKVGACGGYHIYIYNCINLAARARVSACARAHGQNARAHARKHARSQVRKQASKQARRQASKHARKSAHARTHAHAHARPHARTHVRKQGAEGGYIRSEPGVELGEGDEGGRVLIGISSRQFKITPGARGPGVSGGCR